MYIFVDFTSQIAGQRGVPCPTNKGVSYTNLVCWLGCDLQNRLLLFIIIYLRFYQYILAIGNNSHFLVFSFYVLLLMHYLVYVYF